MCSFLHAWPDSCRVAPTFVLPVPGAGSIRSSLLLSNCHLSSYLAVSVRIKWRFCSHYLALRRRLGVHHCRSGANGQIRGSNGRSNFAPDSVNRSRQIIRTVTREAHHTFTTERHVVANIDRVVAGLLILWLVAAGLLWQAQRHQQDRTSSRDALRLIPDVERLLRRPASDGALARGVRLQAVAAADLPCLAH